MKILETKRLLLREIGESDAEFILDLLNQPSFIKFIGDRGVRTAQEAINYIESRFTQSYSNFGFGLYLVELKKEKTPVGICGFVKRYSLPDPDIGFAFLPQYGGQGYAFESADAVMKYGRKVLGFKHILAIVAKDNERSEKLLSKIGFKFERLIKLPYDDEELKLFSSDIQLKGK